MALQRCKPGKRTKTLLLPLQSKLLSDFSFPPPMQMRHPPRIVPPSLLKDVRQVEFVGYVANPLFKRGAPPGEAAKAVAALRNMRQQPKQAAAPALHATALAARSRQVPCQLASTPGLKYSCTHSITWT